MPPVFHISEMHLDAVFPPAFKLIAIAWRLCSPFLLVIWQLDYCVLGVLIDRALACGFPLTIQTLLNIVMTVCPQRLQYLLDTSRGFCV
jgi:hypothetical protein